jgi:hypothetical protein
MSSPIKDLGPCAVIFDGVTLGATMGGVIFRHTEESRPVREDQQGVTNVDELKVGASCECEVPLTRSSLGQLSKVIGNATYTGTKLEVGVVVGESLLDLAKTLILKPIINSVVSTDESTWLTIYKAYPRADLELTYNYETQRVYKVIFKAFPDTLGRFWKIG